MFSKPISVVMIVTALIGVFLAVLFTEIGQILNLPSDWFYSIHYIAPTLSVGLLLITAFVAWRAWRDGYPGKVITIGYVVVMVGSLFVANIFVPEVWLRSQQNIATYTSISDIGDQLTDDDDVFVLEINGDARAYPRDWLMVPHIAGDEVGGEETVMTYCALSNLPQAFSPALSSGEELNLRVVGQLHNNLTMVDTNTDQLYQQITGGTPDRDLQLDKFPTQRMTYSAFKVLYPDGKVFVPAKAGPLINLLDEFTIWAFGKSLTSHYDYDNESPMFPTLSLEDTRLPSKEPVWGIIVDDDVVAFTREFFDDKAVYNGEIGGLPVAVAWFEKYQTMGFFSRDVDGAVSEITEIDAYGNSNAGKLERLPSYPGLFWMIWSHWYPDTGLLGGPTG